MKNMVFAISIAILFATSNIAQGAFVTEKPACDFGDQLAALSKIAKDETLSPQDRDKAELEIKRQLLSASLACGKQELVTLQTNLDAIKTVDGKEASNLVMTLRNKITDGVAYYDSFTQHIASSTANNIREQAGAIQSWRNTNAVFLSDAVNATMLWIKNQTLFAKTDARLEQIKQTVRSYQIIENDSVQNIFERASTQFLQAKEANLRARQSLERAAPLEETFGYMKSSLDQLSQTYRIFFELGDLIKQIIPR